MIMVTGRQSWWLKDDSGDQKDFYGGQEDYYGEQEDYYGDQEDHGPKSFIQGPGHMANTWREMHEVHYFSISFTIKIPRRSRG